MTSQDLYAAVHEEYEKLKSVLPTNNLGAIIEQTLKVHAMVHPKAVSGIKQDTIADYVLNYMLEKDNKTKLVPRMDCGVDLNWAGTEKSSYVLAFLAYLSYRRFGFKHIDCR